MNRPSEAEMRAEQERFAAAEKAYQKKAFDEFMQSPLVAVLISLVPPTNPPELLRQLLDATFKAGFSAGANNILMEGLKAAAKGMRGTPQ